MYLIDTAIVSELQRKRPDADVVAWFNSVRAHDTFLSAITIFEIEMGIERQRKKNRELAERLSGWVENVIAAYEDRILPLTIPIARRWGRLAASIGHEERDLAIAATALEHGLTVVTRNVSDFAPTGVATFNPFQPGARRRT